MNDLKQQVFEANMLLFKSGVVHCTFGNVSGVNREKGIMVIKPSGVAYNELTADSMVVVLLENGRPLGSALQPSSDAPTHLELYRAFPQCGGVAHTHSAYATACAQVQRPIRCMGTTHADVFYGDIPVTRPFTAEETARDYERHAGLVIVETFKSRDPVAVPAVLVANHGPFAWGRDAGDATHNATMVELLAKMEFVGAVLNPKAPRPEKHLVDRHYFRKHGDGAYYGQRRPNG